MYKDKIKKEIESALSDVEAKVVLDRPKVKEHGDLATNVAMTLSKRLKKNPLEIAESIKEKIKSSDLFVNVDVAKPGFINLSISNFLLADSLAEVITKAESFGIQLEKDKGKVLVEYVSANPTGDLHIGHGRQAVLGDSIARVLDAAGYEVSKEFYINDFGEQMRNLAAGAWATYEKSQGKEVEWKEEFYPEEMLKPYVDKVLENNNSIAEDTIGDLIKDLILKEQKELLSSFDVEFDNWFSEAILHKEGKVKKVLELLKESTYESEGATWFKAKELGDVRDRVLVRSDGRPTYLLADIAYHLDKLSRSEKLINVWGADHHGQEVGLKGALKSCGVDPELLEVLFVQMVSLKKGGEEVKMSKRAGTVVTVREVLDEVGPDAFRYFLVESSANNRMAFDIDLALKQDKDNPVFYVQYAHARCCSIFRQLENSDLEEKSKEEIISKTSNKFFLNLFNCQNEEYASTKSLILKILDFPEELQIAAKTRSAGRIANYLKELGAEYHQFYTVCRVLTKDQNLTKARLGLIEATRITIANGLKVLGISAPTKM